MSVESESSELLTIMKYTVKKVKLILKKRPKISSQRNQILYLNLHISSNILQIGDAKSSESYFIVAFQYPKIFFAPEEIFHVFNGRRVILVKEAEK